MTSTEQQQDAADTTPPAAERRAARSSDRWSRLALWRRIPAQDRLPVALGLGVLLLLRGWLYQPGYSGLDPSWMIGINVATDQGMAFGRDLVFTYGPWSFLDNPMTIDRLQWTLGFVMRVLALSAFWGVTYVALRRVLAPAVASVVVTLFTVSAATSGQSGLLLATTGATLGLVLLTTPEPAPGATPARVPRLDVWSISLGVVAALIMQVKTNSGLALLGVAFVLAVTRTPLPRMLLNAAATLVATVVAYVFFWVVIGQPLDSIDDWLRTSVDIVGGYAGAMYADRADGLVGFLVAIPLMVVLLVIAVRALLAQRDRQAIGVLLIVVGVGLVGFKSGFTRHDGHESQFFTFAFAIAAGVVVLVAGRLRKVLVGLMALSVLLIMPNVSSFDPNPSVGMWRETLEGVLSPDGAQRYTDRNVAAARATYNMSDEMLAAIGDKPVAIEPWESAIAYDYDLNWRPLPVLQTYSAYTEKLDRINADFVRTASADQLILRQPDVSIDNRHPRWESPRYQLAVICNYETVYNGQVSWLLYGKTAQNRCGKQQEVSSTEVDADEQVTTPEPGSDEVLVASFEPEKPSLWSRLVAAVYRPAELNATIDGTERRLPAELADGPLLIGYPDQGEKGIYTPFRYTTLSFDEPGTLTFSTIKLKD